VLGVLRDSGYPHPTVGVQEEDGSAPNRVVVTLSVQPGEAANFGDITLNGVLSVSEGAVLRTLAFRPGDLYRESRVLESQRRLNALGLFQFAHVAERPDSEENGHPDGRIPMQVTVAEADPTRLQFGIGYGSEDGGRGSFEWRHRNFLGDARQFTTRGQYSGRLRGMDINLVEPYLFTRALSLGVHGSGWWRDEPAYTSRAFGGGSTVTYRWRQSRGLQVTPIEHAIQVGYNNESLRYALSAETLEDLTQFDELIALGFDPITGQGSGRLAALTVDFDRSAVDATLDPSAGTVLAFHWEHAAPWLGGTFAFDELSGEGRLYVPIGSSVWAGRGRIGVIFADDPQDVPFSGRYFLGGSSSLRGWGRFQVAPLTPDGLPVGGQALVELSTELRMPVAGNFGLVAFLDAGDVWRTRSDIDASALRVSVGPGLRYVSPVGVVRADLGYQLTPIAGLIVSGEPEPRRWRVHFSIGHAF
jgi:translocation and assembly module TamA